jgi:hypothetical protein
VIVGGRYCLQRPIFTDVLVCIEVLRGTRRKLPARCAALPVTRGLSPVDKLDQVAG